MNYFPKTIVFMLLCKGINNKYLKCFSVLSSNMVNRDGYNPHKQNLFRVVLRMKRNSNTKKVWKRWLRKLRAISCSERFMDTVIWASHQAHVTACVNCHSTVLNCHPGVQSHLPSSPKPLVFKMGSSFPQGEIAPRSSYSFLGPAIPWTTLQPVSLAGPKANPGGSSDATGGRAPGFKSPISPWAQTSELFRSGRKIARHPYI